MNATAAARRRIAEHRYWTLARANGEIDDKLEAFQTLRGGERLQEIEVDERYQEVVDDLITYVEEALEEAGDEEYGRVSWAESAMVITVERYIEETNFVEEEDLYRNLYDAESTIPTQKSRERSTSPFLSKSNMSVIMEEPEESEFLLPFPSSQSDAPSTNDSEDYMSRLISQHETLIRLGYLIQSADSVRTDSQTVPSGSTVQLPDRMNRFRRRQTA
jgi:hypothetical protein